MDHPLKKLLDTIWNAGHTPKLLIDATHEDVDYPAHIKTQWGAKLPIDLNAAMPMNIEFTEQGIHADFYFQGARARCFTPWQRIYAVIDRETGQGAFFPMLAPKDALPAQAEPATAAADEPAPRGLRLIKGGKG